MIRQIKETDLPRLKELHASAGFDYPFPDFFIDRRLNPIFESVAVMTDDNDSPVLLIAARKLCEVFAIFDPSWETAGLKQAAFTALYLETEKVMATKGYPEVIAIFPPEVCKRFLQRLRKQFGWQRVMWQSMIGKVRQ